VQRRNERREEEIVVQSNPKTFTPMLTTSGTPFGVSG
jgi:hypothetical protein